MGNHPRLYAVGPRDLIGLGDRLDALGGALFLAAIGLSFWVIYALRREFWWAIIPAGTLVDIGRDGGIAEMGGGGRPWGFFFLGLAATFVLVYLLPNPEGRMKWALIRPASWR